MLTENGLFILKSYLLTLISYNNKKYQVITTLKPPGLSNIPILYLLLQEIIDRPLPRSKSQEAISLPYSYHIRAVSRALKSALRPPLHFCKMPTKKAAQCQWTHIKTLSMSLSGLVNLRQGQAEPWAQSNLLFCFKAFFHLSMFTLLILMLCFLECQKMTNAIKHAEPRPLASVYLQCSFPMPQGIGSFCGK